MQPQSAVAALTAGALAAVLLPAPAPAQNRNEVFIGSYALAVDYDRTFARDEFAGFHVGYSRDVTDHFGFRGSYYVLEHDDVAGLDATGLDLSLVGGLLGAGFNVFAGGGLYSEAWELAGGASERFAGLQLLVGVGYNWQHVGLDVTFAGRGTSDYEDFVNSGSRSGIEASAGTANLNVGYRF